MKRSYPRIRSLPAAPFDQFEVRLAKVREFVSTAPTGNSAEGSSGENRYAANVASAMQRIAKTDQPKEEKM